MIEPSGFRPETFTPLVGLEGPLTSWCAAAIRALLVAASGEPCRELRTSSTLEIVSDALAGSGTVLLRCARPDEALSDALAASGRPLICSALLPTWSAQDLVEREGRPPIESTHRVLADAAVLLPLLRLANVLQVQLAEARNDPVGTVMRMARHLQVPCDDGRAHAVATQADRMADLRTDFRRIRSFEGEASSYPGGGEQASSCVYGALDGLDAAFQGGPIEGLTASVLFFFDEHRRALADGLIPVAGPARLLFFGPFFALPVGPWTARCVLTFSEGLTGALFHLDVFHFAGPGGPRVLAATAFTVASKGRIEMNVPFENPTPYAAIEVRLFSGREIADGSVRLSCVEFRRIRPEDLDQVALGASEPIHERANA